MSRIIVVSNRLPVTVRKSGGEIKLEASIGGLATGMKSAVAGSDSLWVGWPGYAGDSLSSGEREEIASHLAGMKASPVWMSRQDLKDFYHGFCNDVIWPLFHYFPTYVRYDHRLWQAYLRVNSLFADALLSIANEEDEFWIHDYQLMLLPLLIRRALPSSRIGFFLHIPFPSFELFRLLPWRREIIEGILGADLIGLHTYDYVRHFVSAGRRLLGLDHNLGQIRLPDRLPRVDAFPMGIDYDRYAGALKSREARRYADAILRRVTGCRVILSVDRLDYTKGILQRLRGYDAFLEANPGFREKVTMILIVAPSRTSVARYNRLKRAVSELVGTINGRYGTIGWQPVQFIYRAFAFAQLTAVYSISDVLLVTPLRDGMNLIVKEYVATRQDYRGVAVLSEAAGAASELGEALIVNPNNVGEIAAAIRAALEMPEDEQRDRNAVMHRRLRRYTVQQWAKDFLRALDATVEMERAAAMRSFTAEVRRALEAAYRAAARRLFLLNYGGTLVPFADRARRAAPDAELRSLLGKMGGDPANEVVVISGRDRAEMQGWFDGLPVSLIAGQGAWVREHGGEWRLTGQLNTDWKEIIRPILELHADRTPGALVEEREAAFVWSYRRAEPDVAAARVSELRDALMELSGNLGLTIQDTQKRLEIRSAGVSKGRGAAVWLEREEWGLILAAGDDASDEAIFEALPDRAFSFKVGLEMSRARYFVDSEAAVRALLARLASLRDSSKEG